MCRSKARTDESPVYTGCVAIRGVIGERAEEKNLSYVREFLPDSFHLYHENIVFMCRRKAP